MLPKGGRSRSFRLGYTDSQAVEEVSFASQEPQLFNKRMPLRGESINPPVDTPQISTSSFSLYTPGSDSNLFDQSFSVSPEESHPASNHFNGEQLRLLQDRPQFLPSYAWTAESRNFATTFSSTTMEEELTWNSGRESSSASTPIPPFENFSTLPQTQLPIANNTNGARGQSQVLDTARTRTSTRTREPNIPLPSSSERRHTSPKLRTAQSSRSPPTSPNIFHPKANLKRAHNMVEKQYRSRLNSHFVSLLAKIPLELAAASGLETGGKNASKAETLALAERYIGILQEEGMELVKKNKRLEEDYDRLRKAWISSGGVLMP